MFIFIVDLVSTYWILEAHLGRNTQKHMNEITEDSLARLVQNIRYAGKSPVVQYDILDSHTLLQDVRLNPEFERTHPWHLARVLKYLEMRPIGFKSIEKWKLNLWTCLPYQPEKNFVEIVRHRILTDATGLHMELVVPSAPGTSGPVDHTPRLSSYDRDVLSMRLRQRGLRYPRPREIVRELGGTVAMVNQALQRARRAMGLQSMKDPVALRKAVHESGVLMDDPAFR